jgi:hypothetical protein
MHLESSLGGELRPVVLRLRQPSTAACTSTPVVGSVIRRTSLSGGPAWPTSRATTRIDAETAGHDSVPSVVGPAG